MESQRLWWRVWILCYMQSEAMGGFSIGECYDLIYILKHSLCLYAEMGCTGFKNRRREMCLEAIAMAWARGDSGLCWHGSNAKWEKWINSVYALEVEPIGLAKRETTGVQESLNDFLKGGKETNKHWALHIMPCSLILIVILIALWRRYCFTDILYVRTLELREVKEFTSNQT